MVIFLNFKIHPQWNVISFPAKYIFIAIWKGRQIFFSKSPYCYFPRCSLLAICDIPNRNDLIKLIISSLDYGHDVYSRIILSKVLTASDQVWSSDNIIMGSCDLLQAMRLYATKHLRVLLRAKMQFFNNWGIQMLVTQVTCDIIMCYVSCDHSRSS